MKLRATMVNASWDMAEKHINNRVPLLRVEEISNFDRELVLGEINEDEIWITRTHYRDKSIGEGGFSQIGFQVIDYGEFIQGKSNIEDLFDLYLITEEENLNEKNKLKYDINTDLWFEFAFVKAANRNWKEKGYKSMYSAESTGITTSGSAYIVITYKDEKNILYRSPQVLFLPSSMSLEEYKHMIYDLIYLRDELVIDQKSKVALGIREEYPVSVIEEGIDKLEYFLLLVDKNPNKMLTRNYEYKRINSNEKTLYKDIVNKYIYPNKTKHKVMIYKESSNIYENQVIKLTLLRLRKKLEYYLEHIENVLKQDLSLEEKRIKDEKEKIVQYAKRNNIHVNLEEQITKTKEKESKFLEKLRQKDIANISLKDTSRIRLHLVKKLDNINSILLNTSTMETEFQSKYSNDDGWDLTFKYEIYNEYLKKWEKADTGNQKHLVGASRLVNEDLKKHIYLLSKLQNNKIIKIEGLVLIPNSNVSTKDDPLRVGLIDHVSGIKYPKHEIILTDIFKINDCSFQEFCNMLDEDEAISLFYNFDKTMIHKDDFVLPYQHIENQLEKLDSQQNDLLVQKEKLIELNTKIDSLLRLKFLCNTEEVRMVIKPTQIFLKDKIYSQVWYTINNMDKSVIFLDEELDDKVLPLKKTCDIYEIWCYFKMLHILVNKIGWKIEDNLVRKKLDILFNGTNKNDLPNGFYVLLTHPTYVGADVSLKLYYNPTVQGLRPDYHFQFSTHTGITNIYLDAKYRDYGSQGRNLYIDDIEEVAYEKYIKRFQNTNSKASASFIMHCDEDSNYTNFGGFYDKEKYRFKNKELLNAPSHRYGSFKFRPSDNQNFTLWFKMIMEYILPYYSTCWNCGEDKNIEINKRFTKSNYPKFHFYCKRCNSFWVKNHCEEERHKLVKHITSYHYVDPEKKNMWYVKCPKCSDSSLYNQRNPWSDILKSIVPFNDDIPF